MVDDGGYAFPQSDNAETGGGGLSLRDWFAGQALSGLLVNVEIQTGGTERGPCARMVDWAYAYADEMLAKREEQESNGT